MGFSNILKRNTVNEWKDYYVDYDKLRSRIKNRDFKSMLYAEVNKINSFYFLLEKKAVNEKYHLFNEILPEMPLEESNDVKTQESGDDENKEIEGFGKSTNESENDNRSSLDENSLSKYIPLKRGYTKRKKEKYITELLHSLVKIKAYRDLNSSGLLKLAKKYSVIFQNEIFYEKFDEKLKETYFYKSKRVDSIRNLVKKTYKTTFAKDQPEKAKIVFNRLGRGSKTLDIFYILSGFFAGISCALSFQFSDDGSLAHKFICGVNSCYFGFYLFGLCLKLFKFYSINYKFIFNFDMVSSMNNAIYLLMISSLLLISNLIYFFEDFWKDFKPLSLIALIPIVFLFNPLDVLCLNSRIYVISAFAKGLFLPISTIRFRHFYFVDVLTSFRAPIEAITLFVFSNSADSKLYSKYIYLIFPTIRILQSLKRFISSRLLFPHIANAGKYSLAFIFLILDILNYKNGGNNGIIIPTMYSMKFMSSVASFSWDILIDWVIFRNRYMFPKGFYTFAVIFNFITRFYWLRPFILALIDPTSNISDFKGNPMIESLAEITRRFIWTLIRVEVEHLNNCNELKVKKSINLTSGEFFYRKDAVDHTSEVFNYETEFETEMEDEIVEKEHRSPVTDEIHTTEDDSLAEHEDQGSSDTTKESTESYSEEQNEDE